MSYDIFLSDLSRIKSSMTPDEAHGGCLVRVSTLDNNIFLVSKNIKDKSKSVLHWVEYDMSSATNIDEFAMEAYTELALIIALSPINRRGIAALN